MSSSRKKGFAKLRKLAELREEKAQRAAADAQRARTHAEATHVTELQAFRDAQAAPQPATSADSFLQQRQAGALQARSVEQTAAMLERATEEMEASKQQLLDAARERMTYDRLDARARATQAALVARASLRALDDLNGSRRKS